jgi:ribosomal-protein-alanine N-acetyltransferase
LIAAGRGRETTDLRLPVRTSSLLLRPFEAGDSARVCALSQETALLEWIPDQVYRDEAEARSVLNHLIAQYQNPAPTQRPFVLGISVKGTGDLIGHVGLSPAEGEVEIGYAIEEKSQGRGYATQAVAAMAGWGLARFGLSRILGIVSADNAASCRVLEKAGFHLVREAEGNLHGRVGLVRRYERRAPSTEDAPEREEGR